MDTVLEDPVRVFQARWYAIEQTPDPDVQWYQIFYWHYDHETHPGLIPKNPGIPEGEKLNRVAIIAQTGALLYERVLERAAIAEDGRTPQAGELTQLPNVSDIEYLSELQLSIIRTYLPDGNQGIDLAAITEAFEMFSNGELRVEVFDSVWNSEPDSAHEFSFAEFASVAIENNIDAAEWSSLLPSLVMSQEIFTQTYKPSLPPPYFYNDYHSTNFAPEKKVDAAFKQQLRDKYEGKSVNELMEQAVKNAFAAFPAGASRP